MNRLPYLAAFGAVTLLACGGEDLVLPSEGEPAAIHVVQGDGQSGRVGEELPQPLVLEVTDGTGRPVAGATVVVDLAGAEARPDTFETDGAGRGDVEVVLGGTVGPAAGRARVLTPENQPEVEVEFTVIALAASANGLRLVSGDNQSAPAGETLADPLVVEVTDAFGNPIEGVSITWTAEGGGSVSEATTTTAGDGRASVTRTLGPAAGEHRTLAISEGLAGSPLAFVHNATPGSASRVEIVSGNDQEASPGARLPQDLVVRVIDEDGNAVSGAAVSWIATEGGGRLDPSTSTTSADGLASSGWTLGSSPGRNSAVAVVSGVGQAAFTATATGGTAAGVQIVSGNGQSGAPGSRLAQSLVVRVNDAEGNPVSGAVVSWVVTAGGGQLDPSTSTTGADGQASTGWTLGTSAGTNTAEAVVSGGGRVTFTATAVPGNATEILIVSGDEQEGQAGEQLDEALVVRVTDDAGNPVAGTPVNWRVRSGGGSVEPASGVTDVSGVASAQWTLGTSAGFQTLDASAPGVGEVTFRASAVPGSAAALEIVTGNNQSGPVGLPLAEELVVGVVDGSGNPVTGVSVSWVVTAGGGQVQPLTSTTDGEGRASAEWTLGPAPGSNTAQAIVSGVGQVTFQATAVLGAPSAIRIVSGNEQNGVVDQPLAVEPTVEVVDASGNPVPGAEVTWSVPPGGGSVEPSSSTTDASGRAAARWTLGTTTGEQTLDASVSGAGSVTFTATANPGSPVALVIVTQPSGSATDGQPFETQPVVQLKDAFDNDVPRADVNVTASIASGEGTLNGATTVTTNADGRAEFVGLSISGGTGPHSLRFTADELPPVDSGSIDVQPADSP